MNTIIEEITVWRTPDGKTFEDQAEAYRHQDAVVKGEAIAAFVQKHFPNKTDYVKNDIVELLVHHGQALVEVFESVKCQ